MKNWLFLLGLSLALFSSSCKKKQSDDKPEMDHLNIQLISGVVMSDANGNLIGQVGNPNVKSLDVHVFPNPSNGIASQSAQATIATYWLIPGIKNTSFNSIDFNVEYNNHTYAKEDLNSLAIRKDVVNADNLTYDFTSVPDGYYRLFYQMDSGSLGWVNLYLEPSSQSPQIIW